MKTQAGSSRVSMSSKKRPGPDKQSETSKLKIVSKSRKNKNAVSEQFDSDVDIHIEKSEEKANRSCRSLIVERKSMNSDKSIGSPIFKGTIIIVLRFLNFLNIVS